MIPPQLSPRLKLDQNAIDLKYIQVYTLSMLLYEVLDTLKNKKVAFAIIGGYALALHGIVRATMDIDIVIHLRSKDFRLAEEALKDIGLTSRLPITASDMSMMRLEYIKNRNLLAWSFIDYQNPSRQVDILITTDLKDVDTVFISAGQRKIPVISLLELKKMKIKSGRPQDVVDVQRIDEKLKNET